MTKTETGELFIDGDLPEGLRLDSASTPISALLSRAPLYVRENMWADAVWELFYEHGVDAAPVLDDLGRPVGTISRGELARVCDEGEGEDDDGGAPLRAITAEGYAYFLGGGFHIAGESRPVVGQLMQPIRHVLSVDAPISQAVTLAASDGTRQIFAVDGDGVMVGVVLTRDLEAFAQPARPAQLEQLENHTWPERVRALDSRIGPF